MPQLLPFRTSLRPNPLLDEDDPLSLGDEQQAPDEFDLAGLSSPKAAMPVPPPPSQAANPVVEGAATRRYREMLAAPAPSKAPNKWQKLGAIATGAAGGWYNASNPRSAPIETGGTIQEILHPGENERQFRYNTDLKRAEMAAGQENDSAKNQAQITELGARTAANQANATLDNAKAANEQKSQLQKYAELRTIPGMTDDMARSLATTGKFPERVPPLSLQQVEGAMAQALQGNPESAEFKAAKTAWDIMHPEKQASTPNPPASPMAQIAAIRANTTMPPDQKQAAIDQVIKDAKQVADAQRGPNTGGGSFPPAAQDTVESRKDKAMQASSDTLNKEVSKILSVGGDPSLGDAFPRNEKEYSESFGRIKDAVAAHRVRAQRAQDSYEKDVKIRTGKPVQHLELPSVDELMQEYGFEPPKASPAQPAAKPAVAQAAAPGARQLDRETATKYLQQAGGDKEKARALAKADNYTF